MAEQRDSLRVFISYARRDASAFAEELLCGLEVAGFDAFLDRHDIAAGEDWEARLGGLIASADTVVYVLTPASVGSERCKWEVDKAAALSKRVIPIVAIDVAEAETPDALKRLNYIFFSEGHSYSKSLGDLAKALRVDLGWIREHTRLGEVARRWHERARSDAPLLRGAELDAAKVWLTQWRAPAPEPTDLHRALIAASESAEGAVIKRERARQRRVLGAVAAAGVVFAGLAVVSGIFWQRALVSEARAVENQNRAEEEAQQAEAARAQASEKAARASLYEGLYWLRVSVDHGRSANDDWARAYRAFDGGLSVLGPNADDKNRPLLDYGRRYVGHCIGLGARDTRRPGDAESEPARQFFRSLGLTRCWVAGGAAAPAPDQSDPFAPD